MENNFQHEVVNTIYSTTDYSVFKVIGTQREISQPHVKNIMESMRIKLLDMPLIVNEKFQIIEGHHTFEARKLLKKPIQYYVCKDYGSDEMRILSISRKNWNTTNVLESFVTSEDAYLSTVSRLLLDNRIVGGCIGVLLFQKITYSNLSAKNILMNFFNRDISKFCEIKELENRLFKYNQIQNKKAFGNNKLLSLYLLNYHKLDIEELNRIFNVESYSIRLRRAKNTEDLTKTFLDIYNSGLTPKYQIKGLD